DKPANPNAIGTLEEALSKINALAVKPSFLIHTGDITHLSKPSEFDDADRIISQARFDVHYVPGEHDVLDEEVNLYRDRYGRGTKGAGWYSFDANGVHFIGLVNVVDLKAGGLGNLGNDQLEWLEDDLKGRAASTPIVVFAHISVRLRAGCGHRAEHRSVRLPSAAHHRKGGHDRDLDQRGRRTAHGRLEQQALQIESARYRGQILLHIHDTWHVRVLLLFAS